MTRGARRSSKKLSPFLRAMLMLPKPLPCGAGHFSKSNDINSDTLNKTSEVPRSSYLGSSFKKKIDIVPAPVWDPITDPIDEI